MIEEYVYFYKIFDTFSRAVHIFTPTVNNFVALFAEYSYFPDVLEGLIAVAMIQFVCPEHGKWM